jgi:hypothetical protein
MTQGKPCLRIYLALVKSQNFLYNHLQDTCRSRPMAQTKKEIEPQPSPTGVEPEVRGSPLDPSENKVYQIIRTVLVTARQKVYSAINSAMVEAYWEIGRQIEEAIGNRAE